MIKPIFEFILWNNCNNNCLFCPQIKLNSFSNVKQRQLALNSAKDFILSNKYIDGSHVLFVGGEIFDKSNLCIKKDIIDLFMFIAQNMISKKIDLLYLNTNLLYDIDEILFDVLYQFSYYNLFDRIKFTTSYDTYGRFNRSGLKQLFKDNIKKIKTMFNTLNIVVNVIMTRQLCNFLIFKRFSILKYFKDKYGCSVNFLPYIGDDENIKPTINDVFRFLNHENEHVNFIYDYVKNMDLPQDKLVHKFINGDFSLISADKLDCGHVENFKKYSKNNTCFVCDLKTLFNVE